MHWFAPHPQSFELSTQPPVPQPPPRLGPQARPEPLTGSCQAPLDALSPLLAEDPLEPWTDRPLDRFAHLPEAIDDIDIAEAP